MSTAPGDATDPVADRVDRLFGLPLEEFIPERDALAKHLRADGEREAAAGVRKLAKPSTAAWAVNQVVRSQPPQARALLAAGEALRGAQSEMVAGRTPATDVREAADAERAAVAALVEAARGLLSGDGRSLSPAVLERVEQTLHAAAADESFSDELAAGRVTRERKAVGLGPLGGLATPGPPPPASRTPAQESSATASSSEPPEPGAPAMERSSPSPSEPSSADAAAAVREARADQRARRRAVEAAEDALEEAEREREAAERRHAQADEALDAARAALRRADERVAAAEAGRGGAEP